MRHTFSQERLQTFAYPRTFRCPNCSEMINDAMANCKYCGVAIDPGIAALVAERQALTNQAYSDASYLRNTVAAMFVFLALGFVLTIGYVGFLLTFVATTVLLARWQFRFSGLITNDPDYEKAKKWRNVSAILLVAAVSAGIIASPFIDLILQGVVELISLFD